MKNSKTRVIVPCILAVFFLAAGFWMLAKSVGQVNYYTQQITQAEQALAAADPAKADALEQELITQEMGCQALRQLNELLTRIYADRFHELQEPVLMLEQTLFSDS